MTHAPDATLMIFSIAVYAVGAIALITYFFSHDTWLRNAGAGLVIAGCLAQFVQFFVRYELTGVWPFLNLYGSLSLFAAMGVLIFIIFAFRYNLWFAGGFVVAIAAVFLAYGVTWNEGTLPAVPSLQSYWAKVHVPLVVSAYGAFLVSFVLSVLYLVRYYVEQGLMRGISAPLAAATADAGSIAMRTMAPTYLSAEIAAQDAGATRRPIPQDASFVAAAAAQGNPVAVWLGALPSLAQLDVFVYRVVAVGLPLLTLGVITGAMWAREAWGAYWQWDPKETAALFSWIIYAIYMHLHTRSAWRGLRCSWVSVIGFASIIFCYLGVNIWISGLHSYKM